jgi:hypothetical protein
MSAAVESQLPPPRNVDIQAEVNDQSRGLTWPSSSTATAGAAIPRTINNGSKPGESSAQPTAGGSTPLRVNGMINKDDLINSNPFAAASVSNGGSVGHSMASDNDSEDLSRTLDDGKIGADGKKQTRRRKANRACSHCQKAHLTCDDCELHSASALPSSHTTLRHQTGLDVACKSDLLQKLHADTVLLHLLNLPARPCERCVKKGLTDTCTDGARKKAKYLLDEDEIRE